MIGRLWVESLVGALIFVSAGYSTKSAGGMLQLNMHASLTHRNQSGMTMPSRHNVEPIVLLSRCGLIFGLKSGTGVRDHISVKEWNWHV